MREDELPELTEIAIIAALEREVRPLIASWRRVVHEHEGYRFHVFEDKSAVLICGGIGQQAARRATEALVTKYHPELLVSAGFAGALTPSLKVGEIISPAKVIDAKDGSRIDIPSGVGVLVSFPGIVSVDQKAKLAKAYGADAVDMEAAAVALGAEKHQIQFAAIKAISDESSFEMPDLDRFVTPSGEFLDGAFARHALLRPQMWGTVAGLARNSKKASRALCSELDGFIRVAAQQSNKQLETSERV